METANRPVRHSKVSLSAHSSLLSHLSQTSHGHAADAHGTRYTILRYPIIATLVPTALLLRLVGGSLWMCLALKVVT